MFSLLLVCVWLSSAVIDDNVERLEDDKEEEVVAVTSWAVFFSDSLINSRKSTLNSDKTKKISNCFKALKANANIPLIL